MSTRRQCESEYRRRRNATPDPWEVERQRRADAEQFNRRHEDIVNAADEAKTPTPAADADAGTSERSR